MDLVPAHGKLDVGFVAPFLLYRQLPAEKFRLFGKGAGRLLGQVAYVDALHVCHLLFRKQCLVRLPRS